MLCGFSLPSHDLVTVAAFRLTPFRASGNPHAYSVGERGAYNPIPFTSRLTPGRYGCDDHLSFILFFIVTHNITQWYAILNNIKNFSALKSCCADFQISTAAYLYKTNLLFLFHALKFFLFSRQVCIHIPYCCFQTLLHNNFHF